MKNSVKALVLLLTLVLTVSLFTVFAFASETGEATHETTIQPGGENEPTEEEGAIKVKFTTENFGEALGYLWKGMLCIFIVIGALVLVTYGLNKVSSAISNKKSNGNE